MGERVLCTSAPIGCVMRENNKHTMSGRGEAEYSLGLNIGLPCGRSHIAMENCVGKSLQNK